MLETAPLRSKRRLGFTLIELMVVVSILGVLAALAIPAFTAYVKTTKTSEVSSNLNNIFKAASSFYTQERADRALAGSVSRNCIVGTTAMSPSSISNQKSRFTGGIGFQQLGFSIADFVYYGYGITSSAAAGTLTCDVGGSESNVYTFYAMGDIDSDSTRSTFELAVGTDAEGQLYHAKGFYAQLPSE